MTKEEALSLVLQLLRDFLERSEVESIPRITSTTRPIGDLGLESKDGVEWICDLEDSLGIEVAGDENPFLDQGRTRPNTVEQIANWVVMVSGKGTSNG